MTAIHRYEVPVDDQWHMVDLTGQILHVASRRPEVVEVWAVATDAKPSRRELRVFGTGQPLPDDPYRPLTFVGTALAADGRLVWHLLERGQRTEMQVEADRRGLLLCTTDVDVPTP